MKDIKPTPYFEFDSDKLKQTFNLSQSSKNIVFNFLRAFNRDDRDNFFKEKGYRKIIYKHMSNFDERENVEIIINDYQQFLPIIFEKKCKHFNEPIFYFPLSHFKLGSEIINILNIYSPIFISETPCDYNYFYELYGSLLGSMSYSNEEFCVMSASQDMFLFVNNPEYILIFLKTGLADKLQNILLPKYITYQCWPLL